MGSRCGPSFDPVQEIPSLHGRVVLVTGGNAGLGKQAILELARHNPREIWLAARNLDKARDAVQDIESQLSSPSPVAIKLLQIDLNSLASVQEAALEFISQVDRLDILMLNAGIMAAPPGLTKDGYELQFGTNLLGHALLTKLLIPLLEETASRPNTEVRVVNLSSGAHIMAPKAGVVFDSLKTKAESMGAMERYGQSKTASILWIRHMAKLHPNLTMVSVHPGVVQTNLQAGATDAHWTLRAVLKVGRSFTMTVEKGVLNQLWASVSKNLVSGEYYEPIGVGGKASDQAKDMKLAQSVWEWTDAELHKYTI